MFLGAECQRPLVMRFCMVTTFYPPYHFGGDAVFVQALARGLTEAGHQVEVVHCEDAYRLKQEAPPITTEDPDGVVVHRLRSRLGWLSPLITQQTGKPGLKARQLASHSQPRLRRGQLSQCLPRGRPWNPRSEFGEGEPVYDPRALAAVSHAYFLEEQHTLMRQSRSASAAASVPGFLLSSGDTRTSFPETCRTWTPSCRRVGIRHSVTGKVAYRYRFICCRHLRIFRSDRAEWRLPRDLAFFLQVESRHPKASFLW